MSPQEVILQLFKSRQELTVKDIMARMRQSRQMVHIYIRQLIAAGKIERIGHPPKTIYRLKPEPQSNKPSRPSQQLSAIDRSFLEGNFLIITAAGELLEGPQAFDHYCGQRSLPAIETFQAFRQARELECRFRDFHGIYEGSHEHGQNRPLMRRLMAAIDDPFRNLLYRVGAEAIAFIPPIIPRELQLMKFVEAQLDLSLPKGGIRKIDGSVPVPQQSLLTAEERINNARSIFAVTERRRYKRVIVIDDTLASGATLNEVAAKIKDKGIATEVVALTIVSSTNDFKSIAAV